MCGPTVVGGDEKKMESDIGVGWILMQCRTERTILYNSKEFHK